MNTKFEDDIKNLKLILKYCEQVSGTIEKLEIDENKFYSSYIFKNAVAMPILQIGAFCGKLSKELLNKYPNIPWRKIIGLRNRVAHGYDGIDFEIVWLSATENVPELKKHCESVLLELIKK